MIDSHVHSDPSQARYCSDMKVLLIDGHALFRDALCLLIGAHFPDLALFEAGDLASGLAVLAQQPGIRLVLLDRSLLDPEGAGGISLLRLHCPLVRVVVLSADDRPATVAQAIKQGACGLSPRPAAPRS